MHREGVTPPTDMVRRSGVAGESGLRWDVAIDAVGRRTAPERAMGTTRLTLRIVEQ